MANLKKSCGCNNKPKQGESKTDLSKRYPTNAFPSGSTPLLPNLGFATIYVRPQIYNEIFPLDVALQYGTIFPELLNSGV